MRPETQYHIDYLLKEVSDIVKMEKEHWDETHPKANMFERSSAHNHIDICSWPLWMRQTLGFGRTRQTGGQDE